MKLGQSKFQLGHIFVHVFLFATSRNQQLACLLWLVLTLKWGSIILSPQPALLLIES